MAEAETTRGTWRLDEAIEKHWRFNSLDQAFRREWLEPGTTKYQPLHDGFADPVPPGPYCVLDRQEPEVVYSMTGLEVGEERQIVRCTFRFQIHAQDKAGPPPESAKEVCVRLAEKVAAVFDPHNAIDIEGAAHIVTERGPDWHVQESSSDCQWTLEYRWLVDATLKVSSHPVHEEETSTSTSSTSVSVSFSSSSSVSASTTSVTEAAEEEDDVLDFEDIGGVYDSSAAAVANSLALRTYLATRANDSVNLRFGGPKDYAGDTKRQPGTAYLDLSAGTIAINVGGSGNHTHVLFDGAESHVIGVNAAAATTPIFTITRGTGTMPQCVLRNFIFTSNGSVIKIVYGGSGVVLQDIKIEDFTGSGTIDHEGWTEIDAETFSYGIWVHDADGTRLEKIQIKQGSGHGIVATRWHQGDLQARIQHCDGAGLKLEQANGLEANIWAEHCEGYGLMVRDTGANRRASGARVAQDGGPCDWLGWLEGNNGRSTTHTATGYTFSQFRFDSSARIRLLGHTGWGSNMCRLDRMSRLRNQFIEDFWLDPSIDPSLYLVGVEGDVDEYLVNENVVLPGDAIGNLGITNWGTVWPDAADRPTAAIVGTGTSADPERIRITIPAYCYDSAVGSDPAYWRPFNNVALLSPASFYMTAEVKSVTAANTYCIMREGGAAGDGVTYRQTPMLGNFQIAPVSGGTQVPDAGQGSIIPFALWDTAARKFGSTYDIDDTRSDIQPQFTAWASGMQDQDGDATQDFEMSFDIYQMRMYRFV